MDICVSHKAETIKANLQSIMPHSDYVTVFNLIFHCKRKRQSFLFDDMSIRDFYFYLSNLVLKTEHIKSPINCILIQKINPTEATADGFHKAHFI